MTGGRERESVCILQDVHVRLEASVFSTDNHPCVTVHSFVSCACFS